MSDSLELFDCPSCGGALDPHKSVNNLITCQFCGKHVIVPEQLRAPVQPPPSYSQPPVVQVHLGTAQPAAGPAAQAALAQGRRWVSCLLMVIVLTTVIGIGASIAAPLLAAGSISQVIGQFLPGAEGSSQDEVIAQWTASVAELTRLAPTQVVATPTPAFASEQLGFGETGSGPGMFEDTRWLAVSPDGAIYTVDYQTGRVQKFTAAGEFDKLWVAAPKEISQDLAVTRDGTLYGTWGGDIYKFDADGSPLGQLEYSGNATFDSLAATADGGLVAVADGEDVVRFDANGVGTLLIENAVSTVSESSELRGRVAVDGLGKIYVLGTFNDSVFVFSPEGKYLNRIGSGGNAPDQIRAPSDVAVDGKGRVYVSTINGVMVFSDDGRYQNTIDVPGAPFGLAIDDANALYVLSNAPRLMKFEVNP